jgi:hypothetical protein
MVQRENLFCQDIFMNIGSGSQKPKTQKLWLRQSTSGFVKSLNPTPVQFWLEEDNDVLCANYGIISDGR